MSGLESISRQSRRFPLAGRLGVQGRGEGYVGGEEVRVIVHLEKLRLGYPERFHKCCPTTTPVFRDMPSKQLEYFASVGVSKRLLASMPALSSTGGVAFLTI